MRLPNLCAFSLALLFALSSAESKTYDFSSPPRGSVNYLKAEFRCWIPETSDPLRGVLVVIPGQNADGRDYADNSSFQEKCQEWNFALIGCHFTGNTDRYYSEARGGSGRALEDAMRDFSDQSGKRELANAPMVLFGFSAGAQFAHSMTSFKSNDVIAFVADKGVYYTSRSDAGTYRTPALFLIGEDDTKTESHQNTLKLFTRGKSQRALWAMHTEMDRAHQPASSSINEHLFDFVASVVETRMDAERPFAKPTRVRADAGFYLNRETGEMANRSDRSAESSPDWSWFPTQELAEKIKKTGKLSPKE